MKKLFILATIFTAFSTLDAFAGPPIMVAVPQVPTLGEWGMIATVVALGIIGFFALRKRLASDSR